MSDENAVKEMGKSALLIFCGTVLGSGLNYITRILIARHFGPGGYGIISLGLAITTAAITLSSLGLSNGTPRWISKNLEKVKKIKGIIISSLEISLPISLVISIVIFSFSKDISLIFNKPELGSVLKLFSLGIPLGALTYVLTASMRGLKNTLYKIYSYDIAWPLFKVIFVGIVVFFGFSLSEVALAHVFSLVLTSVISIYLLLKIIPLHKIKAVKFNRKRLLFFTWPLMISSILFFLVRWMDIFMLSIFKSSGEVGIYNAALPTASVLIFVLYSFKYMFLPRSTELMSKNNIEEMKENYYRVVRWIFMITLPMFTLMVIFPEKLLGLLFGVEYLGGSLTLSILALGYFYASIVGPTGDILISAGKTKRFMLIFIVIALVNFIMNYFLIPELSYLGAGIALTSSFIIGWSLSVILVYLEFKILPFGKRLLKPLSMGFILSLPLYPLNRYYSMNILQIIIISLIFIAGYCFLLFKLDILEDEELKLIRSLKNRVSK